MEATKWAIEKGSQNRKQSSQGLMSTAIEPGSCPDSVQSQNRKQSSQGLSIL